MTNHDILAFVYRSGPCNHADISVSLGCSIAQVSFRTSDLMLSGLLDFDAATLSFFYSGDAWIGGFNG